MLRGFRKYNFFLDILIFTGFLGLSKSNFGNFQSTLSQLSVVADEKFKQFQSRLDALYIFAV